MSKHTDLYSVHLAEGARLVEFGGWEMPLHYGSQVAEHHCVRREAGMFDVSHMGIVELTGPDSRTFLRRLLANDVAKLSAPGEALYSCMLNADGGVMDDLIVYLTGPESFRLVVNAATTQKDLDWITAQARTFAAKVHLRDDLSMIAVQGPQARARVCSVLPEGERQSASGLKPFTAFAGREAFIARTGYTGEDGFEIIVPSVTAARWWAELRDAGVAPCGLGARDTLRLEAGLNLNGQDMDEGVSPLECGLAWTVAWQPESRDFMGRAALEGLRQRGTARKQVGLVLEDRGVLRSHQRVVVDGLGDGETTSGGYAPTLERSIALARVPSGTQYGTRCHVEIRGKLAPADVVKPPFVRHGKVLI